MDGPESGRRPETRMGWPRPSDPRGARNPGAGDPGAGDPGAGHFHAGHPGAAHPGGDEVGVIRVSAERADRADVIESGTAPARLSWRRSTVVAAVVALVVGGAAGYLAGVRHAGTPAASASAGPELSAGQLPAGQAALAGTGKRCAIQIGKQLQLGVEVVNQSATAAAINSVDTNLPLGGLRQLFSAQGPCGQLAPARSDGYRLNAGATAWLTVTFDVLVPCPAPMPVGFVLGYEQGGRVDAAQVFAFADLGDVPYSGCSASPSG